VANFQGLKSAEVTAMVLRTRSWSRQTFVPAGAAVSSADAAAAGGAAAASSHAAHEHARGLFPHGGTTGATAATTHPLWHRRCAYRLAGKPINNKHTGGGAHLAAKQRLCDPAEYWARVAQGAPAFYRQSASELGINKNAPFR
jgi:hypothetical protein